MDSADRNILSPNTRVIDPILKYNPDVYVNVNRPEFRYTDSGITPAMTDGDLIQELKNKGSASVDFIQNTLAARPELLLAGYKDYSDLSLLSFDGVDDSLTNSAGLATSVMDCTIMLVLEFPTIPPANTANGIFDFTLGGVDHRFYAGITSGKINVRVGDTTSHIFNDNVTAGMHLVTIKTNGVTMDGYTDTVLQNSSAVNIGPTAITNRNCKIATGNAEIKLADLVFKNNGEYTAAEIAGISEILNRRWGIYSS
jgi:hypothetical protein